MDQYLLVQPSMGIEFIELDTSTTPLIFIFLSPFKDTGQYQYV